MSKTGYFRTPFGKRVSGFETLLKSAENNYYQIFPRIWDKLSWEKSVLVRCESLGLFVNTLTAEYKYFRRNMQKFPEQIQTHLSQKKRLFMDFYCISEI